MAVPKRKTSKRKTRSRKAVWKRNIKNPALSECSNCKALKLSHRICPECGHYDGRQVIIVED